MKRLLSLFGGLGLAFSLGISVGLAQQNPDDTVFDGPGLDGGVEILRPQLVGTGIENTSSLTQAVLFWVRILLVIAGILAFIAFLWAGVLFITSFGNEENNEKAKKILIYTGLGIIIILLSYALTNFFINAEI